MSFVLNYLKNYLKGGAEIEGQKYEVSELKLSLNLEF